MNKAEFERALWRRVTRDHPQGHLSEELVRVYTVLVTPLLGLLFDEGLVGEPTKPPKPDGWMSDHTHTGPEDSVESVEPLFDGPHFKGLDANFELVRMAVSIASSHPGIASGADASDALNDIQRCVIEFRSQIEEHLETRPKLRDGIKGLEALVDRQSDTIREARDNNEISRNKIRELDKLAERLRASREELQRQRDAYQEQAADLTKKNTAQHIIINDVGWWSGFKDLGGDLVGHIRDLKIDRDRKEDDWKTEKEVANTLGLDLVKTRTELERHTAVEGGVSMECGHPMQCAYSQCEADGGPSCLMCDLEAKIVKLEAGSLGHEEAVRFLLTRHLSGSITPWTPPEHMREEDITHYILRMSNSLEEWVNGVAKS